jgi:predicted lactoylglutathione lyase
MATQTFINLPVKDLAKTTEFFTQVGFTFDQQFTDENAARMILGEDASVMLAVEPVFADFIAPRGITDTSTSREVIVGLSADSREEVDERVDKALAAGGQSLGDAQDDGFMYMRGFLDLDGHQWSFLHMDMSGRDVENVGDRP